MRETQINVRLSFEEKAAIEANAQKAGKKVGPFLRDLGLSNGDAVLDASQPQGQGGAGSTGSSAPVAEPRPYDDPELQKQVHADLHRTHLAAAIHAEKRELLNPEFTKLVKQLEAQGKKPDEAASLARKRLGL